MKYRIIRGPFPAIAKEDLAFVVLDSVRVFQRPGVRFTEGNLASNGTLFYEDLTKLKKLNWPIIHRIHKCFSPNYKRAKAAEVLVRDSVPPGCVLKIVVYSSNVKNKLSLLVQGHRFESDQTFYS